MSATGSRNVIIVGAGAAGCAVADTLRRHGFEGGVTILDEDPHAPYDRPPLSKSVLAEAQSSLEKIRFPTHAELVGSGVRMERGVRVISCDLEGRQVIAEDGRSWIFDDLVVATGVSARRLPGPVHDRVLTLRTWHDAQALRRSLHRGDSLVIVGGGFLGLEVAGTARRLGCEVRVLSSEERPLEGRLGSVVAERLLEEHRRHGVEVLGGQRIERVDHSPAESAHPLQVRLAGGGSLECDTAVVAIGSEPRTEWLEGSGIDAAGGIRCDHQGRVGEGVWAAGDVAQWFHSGTGTWVRHEHRSSANEQGIAVAHALLDKQPPASRSSFFWTDQYDVKVQVWGTMPPGGGHATFLAGERGDDAFVLGVSEGPGQDPVAIVAWNATRAALQHRAALDRRLMEAGVQ